VREKELPSESVGIFRSVILLACCVLRYLIALSIQISVCETEIFFSKNRYFF